MQPTPDGPTYTTTDADPFDYADPTPGTPPSPHTPQPAQKTTAAHPRSAATWWARTHDWAARAGRAAGGVWRWGVPGGDRLWLPLVWVWRWPWLAATGGCLLVWSGKASVGVIVTVGVVLVVVAAVLSPGFATRLRVASLSRLSTYRKRRRWVRHRWVKMMANGGLVRAKTEDDHHRRWPKLRSTRPHPHGVRCRVDASDAGYDASAFIAAGRQVVATVKARSVRIARIESRRHRGELDVVIKWDDPFPFTLRNSDLEARVEEIQAARRWLVLPKYNLRVSRFEPVVGLDEEGWPTTLDVRKPVLVVAASGHGKSTLLWQVLWQLRKAGLPVLCSVFDPKGGMELGELRHSAWRYVSRSSDWPDFVAAEAAALEGDQLRAAAEGLQDVPWDADHPLRLIVVDELVTALMSSRGQDAKIVAFGMERTTQQAFAVLMSQMRAANRSMAAMSTNPEKDVLGPARTMFPQTALGRVASTEKAAVDIMLGTGASGAYPAHELDPKDPRMAGRFWMRVGGQVTYFRAAQLTAVERHEVAVWMRQQSDAARAKGVRDQQAPRSVTAARAQARAQAAQAVPLGGPQSGGRGGGRSGSGAGGQDGQPGPRKRAPRAGAGSGSAPVVRPDQGQGRDDA